MEHMHGECVAPKALAEGLAWLEAGHRLYVATYAKTIMITPATMAKYVKAGTWLLKEEGNGYRLHTGRKSLCLLPGQLKYIE